MENKNIVMLKRHFVNYKDPKQTKDVVDCPFMSVGHGFILKALLQGDVEVINGEVIDNVGILK